MEYYSTIKKNKIMPFAATWMKLQILILSEVSQKEKDTYHMISLISGIQYSVNEPFHRKENHGLGEQICGCQRGGGGSGMDGALGVNRCRLLPLEWISSEILLCRLGTMSGHLWWSMIMWEKRMYTCMCNWVAMLYSRKLTEHCKPAITKKNHYIKKAERSIERDTREERLLNVLITRVQRSKCLI